MRGSTLRAVGACLGLVAFTGCIIPDRDNPNDPARRPDQPVATLVIRNADPVRDLFGRPETGANGRRVCDAGAESSSLTSFSRGRCVVFDASESEPGNGATIEEVRFDAWYAGEDDDTFEQDPQSTSLSFSIAGIDLVPSIPGGWPEEQPPETTNSVDFTVRVWIRDSKDQTAEALATFTLTNSAPTAGVPPPIVVNRHGAIWEGYGATMKVALDGSRSTDPDEDPLLWCWDPEFDGGGNGPCNPFSQTPPVYDQPASTNVDFTLPANGSTSAFRSIQMSVTDGTFRSPVVTSTIQARLGLGWGYEDDTGAAVQLDLLRRVEPIPSRATRGAVNRDMTAGTEVIAYRGDDPNTMGEDGNILAIYDTTLDSELLVPLPDTADILHVVPYYCPFYAAPHPPDEGTSRFWVVTQDTNSEVAVHVVEKPYLAAEFAWAASIPVPSIAPSTDGFFSAVDTISRDSGRGDLWLSPQFGSAIEGLHYDGAGTITSLGSIPVPQDYMPSALSVRQMYSPTASLYVPELWSVFSRNVTLAGNAVNAYAHVIPLSDLTPCQLPHDVEIDASQLPEQPPVAWSLAWDNEGTAWTNLFSIGLTRFRAQSQNDPCDLTLTLDTLAEDVGLTFNLVTDDQTGQVTAIDQSGSIVRVLPGGFVLRSETELKADSVWSDNQNGLSVVFEGQDPGDPGILMRTMGAGADGVVTRTAIFPAPIDKARAVEYTTGSVWMGTIFPAGAQRVDATGTIADFFGAVVTSSGSDPQLLGPPVLLESDPESGMLYVFGTDDLFGSAVPGAASTIYRIDPRAQRPSPDVATLAPGAGLPDPASGNIPSGLRVFDAAVQPGLGSLVVAGVTEAAPDVLHLMSLSTGLGLLADEIVPDLDASSAPFVFERDLGTNEIVLLYRDLTNDLVMRRYAPDLSSSTVYDFLKPGARPTAVRCLARWCVAGWSDSGVGIALLDPDETLHPEAALGNMPENIGLVVEGLNGLVPSLLRVIVDENSTTERFQAGSFGLSALDTLPDDKRVRQVSP